MYTLSVIIPVYNGEKYLYKSLNSVLKQPCKDLEIIIVDDGSKDSSGKIADEFANKYHNISVIHTPNKGVSHARNLGIDAAKGTYISFLDADDELCKDVYTTEMKELFQKQLYDIFSFSYICASEDLCKGNFDRVKKETFLQRNDEEYIRNTHRHFCSYIYKRDLFFNGIRFPEGLRYYEDMAFLFVITRSAKQMMTFQNPWFFYRNNTFSAVHNTGGADYILRDGVKVWKYAKDKLISSKDKLDCDGNIFSCMVQYITFSCYNGLPLSEIQYNVESSEIFQESMEHWGCFWCHKSTKKAYEEFLMYPRIFWIRNRFIGIFRNISMSIVRLPGIRKYYLNWKYKENTESYIVD